MYIKNNESSIKKLNIFTGHFGSGKTEIAVNFAINLAAIGKQTALVDMDIVNPFFRSSDVKSIMEDMNIKVISPIFANTNVDVPALPAEINAVFEDESLHSVLDVGGDDVGAKVLGRYKDYIVKRDYDLYFVVNTRRPFTRDCESISGIINEIESASGLKVTKLVDNTNVLEDTDAQVLINSNKIISEVSKRNNIDIAFYSGFDSKLSELKESFNLGYFKMEKNIYLPWNKS
jgi:tRNA uridine 5-carbamoylmethylation protein Kti12